MVNPQAKADIRNRFTAVNDKNSDAANNANEALTNVSQRKQHAVDRNDWDGNVFDWNGIASVFDREELEEDMRDVIQDEESPGVVGDLMLITIQGDYLATQERAFRLRHQSQVRAAMHAAARKYGHGNDAGLFKKGIVRYLQALSKASKDAV